MRITMLTTARDDLYEQDLADSLTHIFAALIPISAAAALSYWAVMALTRQWPLSLMGLLSLLLAPACWWGRRLLARGRVQLALGIFTAATLLILSGALVLVRGLDAVIVAGFSVPLLATALLRNVRFSVAAVLLAGLSYVAASALSPLLPWRPLALPEPFHGPLVMVILFGVFGAIGLLSWNIVGMLQRALALARGHLTSLREANARQQETYDSLVAQHAEQRRLLEVIADLETPVIPLQRDVLLIPLVGSLDSRRAEAARARILAATSARRARIVLLDISGVAVVDTAVARQLLLTIQCVRLLGSDAIITGMRGETAQTLVSLGIDLSHVRSLASVEDGIEIILHGGGRPLLDRA